MDARGKLLTVNDGGPVPVASYAYDPGNRVQTFAYRNGAMASYGYNPNGWITSLIQSNASSLIAGFAYDYDRESNKQDEHDLSLLANSEYYNYDAVYQLTNYQAGAGLQQIQETWNFDPLGNWNFTTTNGLLETRTHNAANEIVSLNSNSISYDLTGNLTNDSQLACEYDQENRLVSVRPVLPVSGSLRGDYAYDCFGRRIDKTIYVWNTNQWNVVSSAQFFYDRWLLISRVVGSLLQTSTNDYIWGMDISGTPQGAGGIGGLLCSVESSNYYYYVYDGRGNIRNVLDGGQNTVATYDYVAFGGERTHVGAYADSNPFRFSTKYCDDETGLMYYGGRHYNPGWAAGCPETRSGRPGELICMSLSKMPQSVELIHWGLMTAKTIALPRLASAVPATSARWGGMFPAIWKSRKRSAKSAARPARRMRDNG